MPALRGDLRALEAGQEPSEEVGLHRERRERCVELVRGDEEELVAALDRLLGFGEQAAVVEGERGAAPELLGEPQVGRAVAAPGRGRHQGHDAEAAVAREERDLEEAVNAEPLEERRGADVTHLGPVR